MVRLTTQASAAKARADVSARTDRAPATALQCFAELRVRERYGLQDQGPAFVCCNSKLASIFAVEPTCEQQGATNIWAQRCRKLTQHRSETVALGQRNVIEVQRTCRWHSVVRGEHDFRREATDCSRDRRDNDFVQAVGDLVACEDEHRSTLVR